jgi:cbb3-type cytochrome c oxidase subunit II
MEKLPSILIIAGLGCFVFAGLVMGVLPIAHLSNIEYQSMEELVDRPSLEFRELAEQYPEQFAKYYGEPTVETFREALLVGRDAYIAEACWHCHSQYVRPVSREDERFGKVSYAAEYRNAMNLPHLFGTRRVGPDLIRQAGKHGTEWHVAHFYHPQLVTPTSVMPSYPWFFDGEKPNRRGIGIISYVTWLGSWVDEGTDTEAQVGAQAAATQPTARP